MTIPMTVPSDQTLHGGDRCDVTARLPAGACVRPLTAATSATEPPSDLDRRIRKARKAVAECGIPGSGTGGSELRHVMVVPAIARLEKEAAIS